MRRKKLKQGKFHFRSWGGPRKHQTGRPIKGERPITPHVKRAPLASRFPVHVVVRLREGLPTLRERATYRALRAAFEAGCERFGFRMTHYSVQGNHIHLIAEAEDRKAFSRGMQGLLIRVAKTLNKVWGRKGSVFAERYWDRILRTPREVRNALAYVLNNARRHGVRMQQALDDFASGPWFDGWRENVLVRGLEGVARPIAAARTWLLRVGWRKHPRISVAEVPGPQ